MPYITDFNHDAVASCVLIMQLKRGSMTSPCLCIGLSFFPCIYPLQRVPSCLPCRWLPARAPPDNIFLFLTCPRRQIPPELINKGHAKAPAAVKPSRVGLGMRRAAPWGHVRTTPCLSTDALGGCCRREPGCEAFAVVSPARMARATRLMELSSATGRGAGPGPARGSIPGCAGAHCPGRRR